MTTPQKRLVLLDAHAIIHRAYHAMPDFTTKTGEPTGGMFGLATMLMKAIADLAPDAVIACYDLPGPTFRHDAFDAYKGTRAKADDALIDQLNRSRDMFAAFGIPVVDAPGFEADDMLGTIATAMRDKDGWETIIVTGDMDSLQLVEGTKIRVFTLKKGITDTVLYDEDAVRARFGFGPELLPDYKGLRGDPSDNIPGVPGVGEKTAEALVSRYGDIDAILAAIEKGETPEGVRPRMLALIKEHADEARFSKMLATIRRDAPVSFVLPDRPWKEEADVAQIERLFLALEFRTLVPRIRALLGVSGGAKESEKAEPVEDVDPDEKRRIALALWVLDADRTNPTYEDALLYTGERTAAGAKKKLITELTEAGLLFVWEQIEIPLVPIIRRAQDHGILLDTEHLAHLATDLHTRIATYEEEIVRLAGRPLNVNSPKQLGEVLYDDLGLGKRIKKTATGARSTRESELAKIRDAHPIIPQILAYRELQKLASTYIDTLPLLCDPAGRIHTTLDQAGTTTGRMSSRDPNLQNIPTRGDEGAHIRDAFRASPGTTLVALDYAQIEMRVLAMLSGDTDLAGIFSRGEDIHTSVAARVFRVAENDVTPDMRRRAKVINFGIIYGMGVTALQQSLGSSREEAQAFMDQYFLAFPTIARYFETVKREAAQRGYTTTLFGRRRTLKDMRSPIPYLRAAAERMAMNAPIQGTAADLVKIAMKKADDAIHEAGLADRVTLLLQVHDELIYEVRDDAVTISKAIHTLRGAMESAADLAPTHLGVPLSVSIAVGERWGSMKDVHLDDLQR